ncbi:MAG TPA: ketopantoate reductase family protein [Thermoplasmata archaeon]|nr:ketopantoate reductase family protein [Thermoplasmata archaeon]
MRSSSGGSADPPPGRVLVLGAGAVGSLFGARLAEAGHAVVLVGRAPHVAAIREAGLRVEGVRPGRFTVAARTDVPDDDRFDAVLVAVKTFDLARAGALLARSVRTPRPTLAPQNGLGVSETVAEALRAGGWGRPEAILVRAIHSIPATLVGPGVVRQAGDGEILVPASAPGADVALAKWTGLLRETGFPVRPVADFAGEVWRKAVLNAAINPVTALHGVPNGAVLDEPRWTEARALLSEAGSVAAAEGHRFDPADLEAALRRLAEATRTNRSSMLQDLDRGRPTEVDAISGAILAAGTRRGMDLPVTARVVAALRARAA